MKQENKDEKEERNKEKFLKPMLSYFVTVSKISETTP